MQSAGTVGTEGRVTAMNKVKRILLVAVIVLVGLVTLMLSMYQARARMESEQTMRSWQYDENDSSTWWYEGHTSGDGRASQQ